MSKNRFYCANDSDLNKQLDSIISRYYLDFYTQVTSGNKTITLKDGFGVSLTCVIDTEKLEVNIGGPTYIDVYPYADNTMFTEFVNGLKKKLLMDILTG